MSLDLLLPTLLLFLIAIGFLWVLRVSRSRKELQARLLNVVPAAGVQQTGRERFAGVRLHREVDSPFSTVARLLNVPKDVPLANVLAPPVVFVIGVITAVAFYMLGQYLMSEPMSVVVGVAAGVMATRGVFGWEIARYQTQLVTQLPDTVQLVVSATRAGLPVSEAFKAVAGEMQSPTREEFTRVVNDIALGITADAALLAMYHRTGVTEFAIFAVTIGVQSARARALAGEAKASGVIMSILPFVAGGIMSVTQPKQIAILFNDPRGTRLLVIAIIMLLAGVLTMRHMIAGASSD